MLTIVLCKQKKGRDEKEERKEKERKGKERKGKGENRKSFKFVHAKFSEITILLYHKLVIVSFFKNVEGVRILDIKSTKMFDFNDICQILVYSTD